MSAEALIGWHADNFDPSLASIRYRLLAPMQAMQARGVPIDRFDRARPAESYRAVLFSKSQSAEAVTIARAARAAGRAVIYDICDNVFAAAEAGQFSAGRLERVQELLSLATHVTFSTATLAEQFAGNLPGLTASRSVIADTLDVEPSAATPCNRARADLAALKCFLARRSGALHCVWFGKSLGRLSGYVHVNAAVAELERYAASHPTTLTVISNNRLGYWRSRPRWRVPTHYMPWNAATFQEALRLHRVALIPLESNAYTVGKTLNRPATALLAGIGAIADPIPSYQELAPFITLGNWQEGLERYHAWDERTQADVAAGRDWLVDRYGPVPIAAQWEQVLRTAVPIPHKGA